MSYRGPSQRYVPQPTHPAELKRRQVTGSLACSVQNMAEHDGRIPPTAQAVDRGSRGSSVVVVVTGFPDTSCPRNDAPLSSPWVSSRVPHDVGERRGRSAWRPGATAAAAAVPQYERVASADAG